MIVKKGKLRGFGPALQERTGGLIRIIARILKTMAEQ